MEYRMRDKRTGIIEYFTETDHPDPTTMYGDPELLTPVIDCHGSKIFEGDQISTVNGVRDVFMNESMAQWFTVTSDGAKEPLWFFNLKCTVFTKE